MELKYCNIVIYRLEFIYSTYCTVLYSIVLYCTLCNTYCNIWDIMSDTQYNVV